VCGAGLPKGAGRNFKRGQGVQKGDIKKCGAANCSDLLRIGFEFLHCAQKKRGLGADAALCKFDDVTGNQLSYRIGVIRG
jgi:hypothetical protein